MRRNRNVVLSLCMACILGLTGCMKYVFNYGLGSDGSSVATDGGTVRYDTYPIDGGRYVYFGEGSHMRYDQLDSVQKSVYDEVYTGILDGEESISVSEKITEDDLQRVFDAVINTADFELVCPTRKYNFKYDSVTNEVYRVDPKYETSLEARTAMVEAVDEVANEVVSQTQGLDEFQTVQYFHDYVVLNCSYSSDGEYYDDAYGALVDGSAVCEGYARAFKYLCDKASIPCELVIGYTDVEHMWNVVQINGNWYHIDLTWDDPKNKDGDYISYSYFNLTEEEILADHTIDDSYEVPSAVSTDMDYYRYYGLVVDSLDDFESVLYGSVYDACSAGKAYVYLKASTKETYQEVLDSLSEGSAYATVREASSSAGVSLDASDVSYGYDGSTLTVTVHLKY